MRLLRYWRFCLGTAALLGAGAAFATDPPSTYPECVRKTSPADLQAAKTAHDLAFQFYERGDYDKAVRYWSDAYNFDCHAHKMLLNLANAYERKGDKAGAIVALETFLKRTGSDPTLEEKVRNLKAALAPPPPPTATAPRPPASAPTVAPTGPQPPPTSPTAAPTALPPEPDGPRPYGVKPWIMVGAGGGVALIGAILLPVGMGAVKEAEKLCPQGTDPVTGQPARVCPKNLPNGQTPQSVANKGNAGRIETGVGGAFLGVGIAAAAGGLVWQLVFNKPEVAKSGTAIRVLPAVGPTGAGMTVGGAF